MLAEKLVVFGVASDPEPKQPILYFNREGTMVKTNADRPIFANLLEMEGRVMRIGFQQFKARIRQLLNLPGKEAIAGPEVR